MSSLLASRRLRTPAEAFALCLRPLPAAFHPDVRREPAPTPSPFVSSGRTAARQRAAGPQTSAIPGGRAPAGRPERTAPVTRPSRPMPSTASAVTNRATRRPSVAPTVRRTTGGSVASAAMGYRTDRGSGRAHATVGATALLDDLAPESVELAAEPRRVLGRATALRAVPAARATVGRSVPVVRSHRWRRRIRMLLAGTLLSGVVLIAFAAVAMHSQLASRQLRLNVLRTEVDTAEREHQRLRLTVAELDTPEQVVSSAYRLGLVGAAEVEFLPTASTMPASARTAGPTVPDLTRGR